MKNIKKISLYFIVTFSIINTQCAGDDVAKKAARALATGFVDATKIASEAGIQMARDVGIESTKAFAEASIEVTKTAGDAFVQGAENVGLAATQQLSPYVDVAVAIYALGEIATKGAELYAYNNPDEEKKAKTNEALKKNEFYECKRKFRSCLINNSKAERGASGLPVPCEEVAHLFTMIAGKAGFEEMAERFKVAYPESKR